MTVIVRFAPSPTGYLHIGGARTALVNYAFAKAKGGKFLLRIEDTDKERSTDEYIETIYNSLKWLGIEYDDEPLIQSTRLSRHAAIAHELCENKQAYFCFCTKDELDEEREKCTKSGTLFKYTKKCRVLTSDEIAEKLALGLKPTIRVKAPDDDSFIEVDDMIKGNVKIHSKELDDFIILRSDNTPTYMLSVVVDDHDTNITHVIRGDDHFTNTFRQIVLYNACKWASPTFGHLPLIYGPDGKKMSKRFHAVGTDDYKNMGYLPESVKLYLSTIGYSSASESLGSYTFNEFISHFDIAKISKSPGQFDINFLNVINQRILKSDVKYLDEMIPFLIKILPDEYKNITSDTLIMLTKAYDEIVSRCKNLKECAELATLYFYPDRYDPVDKSIVEKIQKIDIDYSTCDTISSTLVQFISDNKYKKGDVFNLLRNVLTGKKNSPNIFGIMYCIGKNEVQKRLANAMLL